jgi:hypothetical protein
MMIDDATDNAFSKFLQQKKDMQYNITEHVEHKTPDRLTSEGSADIDSFIEMLSRICTKVMKKMGVEFCPDEGARLKIDQIKSVDHPYILFKILDSSPVKELKPRIREEYVAKDTGNDKDEEFLIPRDIWGQLFRYRIQFDIFADGYKQAVEVMKIFEDIVFSYIAYFKRQGVKDVRFLRRTTDSNLDIFRQKCSVRSLQYDVDIEKLFTRYETTIGDIVVR